MKNIILLLLLNLAAVGLFAQQRRQARNNKKIFLYSLINIPKQEKKETRVA